MLQFIRNKLVTVRQENDDTLIIHGILEDDIYGLEIDVTINVDDLKIIDIQGKWNRWTTPECPRSNDLLQEAIGYSINDEGFTQKVNKTIGRNSCRHYANILLECCHTAKEATRLIRQGEPEQEVDSLLEAPAAVSESKEEKIVKRVGPDQRPSNLTIIDLHTHSFPASACSSVSVDRLIQEAKAIGLDGICITDHNHTWDSRVIEELRQKHGFLILKGNEITTDNGDILVFGTDIDVNGIIELRNLREQVLKKNGFMIAAHPFRGFLTFSLGKLGLTVEKAAERPMFRYVDALEVMNGKVTDEENEFSGLVADALRLPGTGGSDAHEERETGMYATRFSCVINNEKDLLTALQQGDYISTAYGKEKVLK